MFERDIDEQVCPKWVEDHWWIVNKEIFFENNEVKPRWQIPIPGPTHPGLNKHGNSARMGSGNNFPRGPGVGGGSSHSQLVSPVKRPQPSVGCWSTHTRNARRSRLSCGGQMGCPNRNHAIADHIILNSPKN